MSFYDIGRDVERLIQRVTKLEQSGQTNCGCSEEQEEVFYPLENEESFAINFIPLTPAHTLITVTVFGTEVGNGFEPNTGYTIQEVNGFKVMTIIHPSDTPFSPSDYFQLTISGLGFGRGWCKVRNGVKCKKINLDEDCVDKDAYMNRCADKCPFYHLCGGQWSWSRDTEGRC